jgi:hypothetical protein
MTLLKISELITTNVRRVKIAPGSMRPHQAISPRTDNQIRCAAALAASVTQFESQKKGTSLILIKPHPAATRTCER